MLQDTAGDVITAYDFHGLPSNVIIDQKGIVRYIHSEYDPQVMLQTIDELLGYSSIKGEKDVKTPEQFKLHTYPNPFNGQIRLEIKVPVSEQIILTVFDSSGRILFKKDLGMHAQGTTFESIIDMSKYSSGVFFARINAGSNSATSEMVLIK